MDLFTILSDQKAELLALDIHHLVARPEEHEIDINSKFAQVVIGVRRCGKSTLCQKVLLESQVNFGYINFDDERLKDINSDKFDDILATLYRLNGDFKHLFLDEVQNVDQWQLFVNRLLRQGMHLVITGSNANLLGSDLTTHLAGRYNEIELFPFSFSEYCDAKKINKSRFTTKDNALLKKALDEYLQEGGFPEIVEGLAPRHYARNLISTIVKKDVTLRYKVRYTDVLWKLTNTLLDNICGLISAFGLAEKLGVKSFHTIERYVGFLHNAYLILALKKYSPKAIERKLRDKGYAIDMAFVSDHEDRFLSEGLGWRLENTIAIEIFRRIKTSGDEVYYLGKNREYDVDFIITRYNRIKELIQVTYDFRNPSMKLYNREVGNLIRSSKALKCDNLTLIIMEGEEKEIESDGCKIKIINAVNWLLNRY